VTNRSEAGKFLLNAKSFRRYREMCGLCNIYLIMKAVNDFLVTQRQCTDDFERRMGM